MCGPGLARRWCSELAPASGIFGPLVYGWIVYMSGSRAGLCALAALSVPSLWLVSLVDFDVGRQCNESQPIENDSGPDEDVYV